MKTGIGELRAWKLTPVPPPTYAVARSLTLGLSEDARRLGALQTELPLARST